MDKRSYFQTETPPSTLDSAVRAIQRWFLALLLCAYFWATFAPSAGLWLRGATFSGTALLGEPVTLIKLMLAALLCNAGMEVDVQQLRRWRSFAQSMTIGWMAQVVIPLAVIGLFSIFYRQWPGSPFAATLVGLALVAAMPTANSSVAWSQNAGGCAALGLGLVLATTLACPLTAPASLWLSGYALGPASHGETFSRLAETFGGWFVTLWVVGPSLLGLLLRHFLGADRILRSRPVIRLVNLTLLLLLNYANASVSLPQAALADAGTIISASAATIYCACLFLSAFVVGAVARMDSDRQIALVFGLGMKNTGIALTLATSVPTHPACVLVIIFHTLAQHLLAGLADRFFARNLRREKELKGSGPRRNSTKEKNLREPHQLLRIQQRQPS